MKRYSPQTLQQSMEAIHRRSLLTVLFALPLMLLVEGTTASQAPPPESLPDFAEVTLDGIAFIKIPAGTYRCGTTEKEQSELAKLGWWRAQNRDEQPAHAVTIPKPFLLGKYEVTQAQWRAVMGEKNPAAFKGDALPVESIPWNDAQTFCKTLSEKTKATYRLPTEAEWEYAARAGGEGPFGLASDKQPITPARLDAVAWMNSNAGYKTHPVGEKAPNAWGLCDLLGNVWEWCADGYSPTAYTATAVSAPLFPPDRSTERVFRGGCYFLDGRAQRVAIRGGNLPDFKSPYVGFRLLREL